MLVFTIFILSFCIAAIGVIAPGMLNITVAKISIEENKKEALLFAVGATIIVVLQSFVGVYFAKFLDANASVSEMLKKFGIVIFILLTVFFVVKGRNAKKENIKVTINKKRNSFLYGSTLSLLNMFAVPYYAMVSLTLASKGLFVFYLPEMITFSIAAALGVFVVFYLYAMLFKKIEHKMVFILKNINFLIATITGLVALSSLYTLFFS